MSYALKVNLLRDTWWVGKGAPSLGGLRCAWVFATVVVGLRLGVGLNIKIDTKRPF